MGSVEVNKRTSRPTFDFETELQNESIIHESQRVGNPYNDPDSFERRIPQPAHGGQSSPSSSYPDQYHDITLGQYILDRVGDVFKGLFRNSQTILRVDLRQALRYDVPLQKTPLVSRKAKSTGVRQPNRFSETEVHAYEEGVQSKGWFQGLQGGGARLKLMQVSEQSSTYHISCMLSFLY